MNDLREKLQRALVEHQQESGLHVIGGRDRLLERLLRVLSQSGHADETYRPEQKQSA